MSSVSNTPIRLGTTCSKYDNDKELSDIYLSMTTPCSNDKDSLVSQTKSSGNWYDPDNNMIYNHSLPQEREQDGLMNVPKIRLLMRNGKKNSQKFKEGVKGCSCWFLAAYCYAKDINQDKTIVEPYDENKFGSHNDSKKGYYVTFPDQGDGDPPKKIKVTNDELASSYNPTDRPNHWQFSTGDEKVRAIEVGAYKYYKAQKYSDNPNASSPNPIITKGSGCMGLKLLTGKNSTHVSNNNASVDSSSKGQDNNTIGKELKSLSNKNIAIIGSTGHLPSCSDLLDKTKNNQFPELCFDHVMEIKNVTGNDKTGYTVNVVDPLDAGIVFPISLADAEREFEYLSKVDS